MRKFIADKKAVTALEYGVIAGVLGLVLLALFSDLGVKLAATFTTIDKHL